VLTLTFLAQDSRSDVPKVSDPTALDIYIFLCFIFLCLAMLEFVVVHYYTKFDAGDPEMRVLESRRIYTLLRRTLPTALLFRCAAEFFVGIFSKIQKISSKSANGWPSRANGTSAWFV
jgi:hypothetical protein